MARERLEAARAEGSREAAAGAERLRQAEERFAAKEAAGAELRAVERASAEREASRGAEALAEARGSEQRLRDKARGRVCVCGSGGPGSLLEEEGCKRRAPVD